MDKLITEEYQLKMFPNNFTRTDGFGRANSSNSNITLVQLPDKKKKRDKLMEHQAESRNKASCDEVNGV